MSIRITVRGVNNQRAISIETCIESHCSKPTNLKYFFLYQSELIEIALYMGGGSQKITRKKTLPN